ncbi:DUF2283 domain-containing protein [Candidatus Parcubacteria bacterium]|nr:MAG: DUF2283 domain-containing protein [Candidatus Parcubacteria bacterium]
MACITLKELIDVLKANPNYKDKWEKEVSADQALYVRFATEEVGEVESEVLETYSGHELVIDRDSTGKVVGIEII